YDGTITNVDTFDLLVRSVAGNAAWDAIEVEFHAKRITLREALQQEAALVRVSQPEAFAILEAKARVDPTFASFVATARAHGGTVSVVSSGLRQVIEPALKRIGADVPVFANDVVFDPAGWRLTFLDDSANGHDKATRVRTARETGARTVYIGDGISDYEAALAADVRFAKGGRALERYCRDKGVAFTSFESFAEIERAMFPSGAFSRPGPSSLDRESTRA
ncbi:MAG TPA: HAD-IB family phosphatase, partial [Candidatus Baltobacteraceae bacterium]